MQKGFAGTNNQTNKRIVRTRDDPALPQLSTDQQGRDHRQHARNVIQPQHEKARKRSLSRVLPHSYTDMETPLTRCSQDSHDETTNEVSEWIGPRKEVCAPQSALLEGEPPCRVEDALPDR